MIFDQFPYRRIPIWENWHRRKVLKNIRVLLINYFSSSDAERRHSINALMLTVIDMSRLVGVSFQISSVRQQRLAMDGYPISFDYDLLENFAMWDHPALQSDLIDLLDRAIGVYNGDKRAAWWRTFCPFYWTSLGFEWIARLLLRTFADFGVEAAAEPNSRFSRIVRRILGLFIGFSIGFVPAVFAYLDFFNLKNWFLELLGRPK
jgi:hypothetical protein